MMHKPLLTGWRKYELIYRGTRRIGEINSIKPDTVIDEFHVLREQIGQTSYW
jgi:hypothetical protein